MPTTRRRYLPDPFLSVSGSVVTDTPTANPPEHHVRGPERYVGQPGTQVTVSSGHPFHSRVKGNRSDLGGDFYTKKQYMTYSGGSQAQSATTLPDRYGNKSLIVHQGPMLPLNPRSVGFPPDKSSSTSELEKLGATAVSRCKPTNSVANLATALIELRRDGLPNPIGASLWETKTIRARNAGEEFLNYEFGWQPLVSDVKSFAKAVSSAKTVLEQYERDAGKVVRRRYNFPEHRESETINVGDNTSLAYMVPDVVPFDGDTTPRGPVLRTRETVRRQWYSGAFTYALPSGYDSRSTLDKYALYADQVFGLSLTPETLWNAAPWSWAVDWFSNTGDVISNISSWSTDGLVQLYGYVMEHTITTDTYTMRNTGRFFGKYPASSLTLVTETKIRTGANPFGFGISWDGLSPIQQAIAAAIGITRKR